MPRTDDDREVEANTDKSQRVGYGSSHFIKADDMCDQISAVASFNGDLNGKH